MNTPSISLLGIPDIPLVQPGDDLAALIAERAAAAGHVWQAGDVIVITSKIVSKAEGRLVRLSEVEPDAESLRIAEQCGKDPREVALILGETRRISRVAPNVLIVERHDGIICANAGMDHSNVDASGEWRLLLPQDANQSAASLRDMLQASTGQRLGVVVSDSHGRPFRLGTVGVAIGAAGLPSLLDLRGKTDIFGHTLQVTEVALADEIAAAAGLLMGQRDEKLPVVVVRGLRWPDDAPDTPALALLRPPGMDLYR